MWAILSRTKKAAFSTARKTRSFQSFLNLSQSLPSILNTTSTTDTMTTTTDTSHTNCRSFSSSSRSNDADGAERAFLQSFRNLRNTKHEQNVNNEFMMQREMRKQEEEKMNATLKKKKNSDDNNNNNNNKKNDDDDGFVLKDTAAAKEEEEENETKKEKETKKREFPSKFDMNEKANKEFTPNRYDTQEKNEQRTKEQREMKRIEYDVKIKRNSKEREYQLSDHTNAIQGDGTVVKYYEKVDIKETNEGHDTYEILLDDKPLKSPTRNKFVLPNKLMACAIAEEWAMQDDNLIRPFTMPLMQLASTALDHMSKQEVFDFHKKKLLEFFDADQAVIAHPPGELRELQLETLEKVHKWAKTEFGDALNLHSDSIFASPQTEEIKLLMEKRLRTLSAWEMTCTFAAAAAAKSLLIGLALTRNIITPEEALKCARVEEDYQIERHGFVEGGHDIDISDLRVRLTAPHTMNLILKAKTSS